LKRSVTVAQENGNRHRGCYCQVKLAVSVEIGRGHAEGSGAGRIVHVWLKCAIAIPQQDRHRVTAAKIIVCGSQVQFPVAIKVASDGVPGVHARGEIDMGLKCAIAIPEEN